MNVNYIGGYVHGFVTASIMGFFYLRMIKAGGTIKQRKKTLDNFPAAIQSKTTPAKIVQKSFIARLKWLLWLIIILVVFVLSVLAALQT